MSDLISRAALFNACSGLNDKAEIFSAIQDAPAEDAVPITALLKLRDWLYESCDITMGGLGGLNALMVEHSSSTIPHVETGIKRSNR